MILKLREAFEMAVRGGKRITIVEETRTDQSIPTRAGAWYEDHMLLYLIGKTEIDCSIISEDIDRIRLKVIGNGKMY